MRNVSFAKRVSALLLAIALVFSCVLCTYAAPTFSSFTGDSSRGVVTVDLSCTSGGAIHYDVATDSNTTQSGFYSQGVPIGVACSATAIESQDHPFLYWKDNFSERVFSYDKTIRFTTSTMIGLTAVFSSADATEHMVQYVNYGDTLLFSNTEYKKGVVPTPPSNPTVPGLTFNGWSMTPSEIAATDDNVLVTPRFTVNNETYTVTITNDAYVSGAGTYSNYQTVNLSAEEKNGSGQTFSYWKDANDEIVSYDRNYSFRINYNVTLTAVYGETVTPQPIVRTTKIVRDANGMRITFFMERSVPDTYTVVSHGLLVSTKASIQTSSMRVGQVKDLPTAQVRRVCGTSNENCGTFSVTKTSVTSGTTVVTRAYLICMDASGAEHILYGNLMRTTLDA